MTTILTNENTAQVRVRAPYYMDDDGHRGIEEIVHTLATTYAVADVIAVFCLKHKVSPRCIEFKVTWPNHAAARAASAPPPCVALATIRNLGAEGRESVGRRNWSVIKGGR